MFRELQLHVRLTGPTHSIAIIKLRITLFLLNCETHSRKIFVLYGIYEFNYIYDYCYMLHHMYDNSVGIDNSSMGMIH